LVFLLRVPILEDSEDIVLPLLKAPIHILMDRLAQVIGNSLERLQSWQVLEEASCSLDVGVDFGC